MAPRHARTHPPSTARRASHRGAVWPSRAYSIEAPSWRSSVTIAALSIAGSLVSLLACEATGTLDGLLARVGLFQSVTGFFLLAALIAGFGAVGLVAFFVLMIALGADFACRAAWAFAGAFFTVFGAITC